MKRKGNDYIETGSNFDQLYDNTFDARLHTYVRTYMHVTSHKREKAPTHISRCFDFTFIPV